MFIKGIYNVENFIKDYLSIISMGKEVLFDKGILGIIELLDRKVKNDFGNRIISNNLRESAYIELNTSVFNFVFKINFEGEKVSISYVIGKGTVGEIYTEINVLEDLWEKVCTIYTDSLVRIIIFNNVIKKLQKMLDNNYGYEESLIVKIDKENVKSGDKSLPFTLIY